jgi:hypothetical protein
VPEREEIPPIGTAAEELLPLPVLDALELLDPDMKSSGLLWCKRTPGPEYLMAIILMSSKMFE